jgi:hypothetical protein
MNNFKNKIKILIRNIKHLIKLIKDNEIPKKSVLKLSNISDPKDFKINNSESSPLLLLSSKYHRVTKSRFKEINKMIKKLHNFQIFFFSHKNRDLYMKKNWKTHNIYKLYEKSIFQQMKSDIFRYCFVYDNGGYWLDFKCTLYFDIDNLMNSNHQTLLVLSSQQINENEKANISEDILSVLSGNIVNNWVFGAKKNSNFLKFLIDDISTSYHSYENQNFYSPKNAILELTGPLKITKLFLNYIETDSNNLKEFFIVNESDYEFQYISDFGRDFHLSDNVFSKHYSRLENKKIIKY